MIVIIFEIRNILRYFQLNLCLEKKIQHEINKHLPVFFETFINMSYGATVGASAANSNLIKLNT